MTRRFAPLPTDFAGAHALILAELAAHLEAEADAAQARTVNSKRDSDRISSAASRVGMMRGHEHRSI